MKAPTNDLSGMYDRADAESLRESSPHAAAAEVRNLLTRFEKLLQCEKDAADPELARARAEVQSAIGQTRKALPDGAGEVRYTVTTREHYIHEPPWRAIGVAAVSGIVIGLLLRRWGSDGAHLS